jgi:hypothetical protein
MSNNDIEVRIGAQVGPLQQGMNDAGQAISDGAKKMADGFSSASKKMEDAAQSLMGQLTQLFSLGAVLSFVKSTKDAVTEAEASFRGLEAVANYTGVGIGRAMEEAQKLASDGMMTVAESSKALQNLLSRGYSVDQAVTTLTRLKDAAAFNRQASLEMGEAVLSATEGLKNENSILVDNAGVTKNVAKMWEEYAKAHGKSYNQLTQAEKIQAEYIGIMAETEAQVGNAAKAMNGMQGQTARLEAETQNLKIAIGQGLTPLFTGLAQAGVYVINNFAKPLLWYFEGVGIGAGALATKIGILWDAVTSMNFQGVNAKLQAAENLRVQMLTEAAAKYESPMGNFRAGVDSGKRRAADPAAPAGKTGGKKSASTSGTYTDSEWAMLEQAHDTKTSYQLAEQRAESEEAAFDRAVKAAEAWEADLERANAAVADATKRSVQQRLALESLWGQNAAANRLAAVDAAQAQAQHDVDMGLMTKEELLAQEEVFEQSRYQIRLAALQERLALMAQDPDADPVAKAQAMVAIEELERQHQATMTGIRHQAAMEQAAPFNGAIQGIEQSMASSLQRLMMLQTNFAGFMRSLWQGVMSSITSAIAQEVSKWIMNKVKAMIFGKVAALSEITRNAGVAGAGGVASMAAAPFPLNLSAPAFGAAMSAAAMAFAPAASASGGYDIPAGINPITQLHAREMVLPEKHADVIRGLAGEGGDHPQVHIHNHITAMDSQDVRRALVDGGALQKAMKDLYRGFAR